MENKGLKRVKMAAERNWLLISSPAPSREETTGSLSGFPAYVSAHRRPDSTTLNRACLTAYEWRAPGIGWRDITFSIQDIYFGLGPGTAIIFTANCPTARVVELVQHIWLNTLVFVVPATWRATSKAAHHRSTGLQERTGRTGPGPAPQAFRIMAKSPPRAAEQDFLSN